MRPAPPRSTCGRGTAIGTCIGRKIGIPIITPIGTTVGRAVRAPGAWGPAPGLPAGDSA